MRPLVGLAGLPNSGKSSIFNMLTGSRQRVANYPGVTVERKQGEVKGEKPFDLIDLPGLYTLDIHTLDEKVARDFLLGKGETKLDKIVVVLDSTNLEKSLYLALQLQEIGHEFILVLNMMDLATKRGLKLDLEKLGKILNCPVISTVAYEAQSIKELRELIELNLKESKFIKVDSDYQSKIKTPEYIKSKFQKIDEVLKEVTINKIRPDSFSRRVDNVVLHPVSGTIILLGGLLLMFQALFSWADPLIEMIEAATEWLSVFVASWIPAGDFQSFVTDGIIAGVGGFIVFLPHILMLFLFILLLEDIGYLGRAAFLMDALMRRFGLPGKAAIPLLSSHACAIPGIMSARIIKNDKDRLATMLVAPLTTCSARIPVYTMLIAAMFAQDAKIAGLSVGGLFMFGLYTLGIVSSFIVAFVLKKKTLAGPPSTLLMELPPYRIPRLKNILRGLWHRAVIFCKKAGTVILFLSMLIWVMTTYPKAPENATEPTINYSMAARVGKTINPIFKPLGFDWKITTSLIPTFGAREVMVASMGTILSLDEESKNFESSLIERMRNSYGFPTLFALIIWFVYAPQCIATFGVLKRETDGYKWPLFTFGYTLTLAYVLSFIANRIGHLIS